MGIFCWVKEAERTAGGFGGCVLLIEDQYTDNEV